MEDSVGNICEEMLEKLAELDFSPSHLRDLNEQMRVWLESAHEMTLLRSENAALGKQVKDLEQIIRDAVQDETEPCRSVMDDTDAERWRQEKILRPKQDSSELMEENNTLVEQVTRLEEQREQDKISLNKLKVALNTMELEMVEARVEVQHRDELIEQTRSQLKQAEVTVQECYNVIEDLRQTNQQLRQQLEEKQEEITLAHVRDVTTESEGRKSPPLSFAEEIQLLISSTPIHQEKEQTEVCPKPPPETVPESPHRSLIQVTGVYLCCAFILTGLALVIVLFCLGISNTFVMKSLWTRAHLHYYTLPPI
ncbi:uncharacterized protein ACB058_011607 [Synchiropus picturatus]